MAGCHQFLETTPAQKLDQKKVIGLLYRPDSVGWPPELGLASSSYKKDTLPRLRLEEFVHGSESTNQPTLHARGDKVQCFTAIIKHVDQDHSTQP